MSRLDELIRELCPDGVPHKRLSDLGTLTRGKRFVHADAVENGVPCIHYGELYTHYGVYTETVKSHVRIELAGKLRYAHKNDVIIVGAGENDTDIGIGVAYLGDEAIAVHDACYIFTHDQDPKYVSYWLRTADYHTQIKKYVSSGKICAISAESIGKAVMPVPPIEVQREIVRILDKFTELSAVLSAELSAELSARQRQYSYYREQLLTFRSSDESIQWYKLSEIASYKDGVAHERIMKDNGPYIVVKVRFISSNGGYRKYADTCLSPVAKDDTIMVMSDLPNGKSLAKCYLVEADNTYTINQRVCCLTPNKELVHPKFLYYVLNRNSQLLKYDTGYTQTHLKKAWIQNIMVPIPPMFMQQHIVSILEHFDALCNDLSSGLPAEIEARRKQYEYYRDKLLTFKPLA